MEERESVVLSTDFRAKVVLDYDAVDGYHERGEYMTITAARAFAHKWVGPHPDCGNWYAVSNDGIGKITPIRGCTLADLFPDEYDSDYALYPVPSDD